MIKRLSLYGRTQDNKIIMHYAVMHVINFR